MQTEQQKQYATSKDANFFNEINQLITKKIGDRKLTFGTCYETENICRSFGNFPPMVIEALTLQLIATNPEFEQKLLTNYLNRQKENIETNVVPMVKMAIDIFKPLLANVSNDLFSSGNTVEEVEEKPMSKTIAFPKIFNEAIAAMSEEEKQSLEEQLFS